MKVLIACEYSGTVRDAFLARGHDAISCDLLPTESPGPHIQGDVRPLLQEPWDLVIAFPPCSYLSHINEWMQNHKRNPRFWTDFVPAVELFQSCQNANAPKVAVENPKPASFTTECIGKYSQAICPSHFGEQFQKRTCLWLRGLPGLMATYINPRPKRFVGIEPLAKDNPKRREQPGVEYKHGLEYNSQHRSRFWPGIARAMAEQWG